MTGNFWIVAVKFGSFNYNFAGQVWFYGEGGRVVKDRKDATRFYGENGEDFALRAADRVLRTANDVSDAWTEGHSVA